MINFKPKKNSKTGAENMAENFFGKVMLAPMAGEGDYTFRASCKKFGADYLVSEMISAKAILNPPLANRYKHLFCGFYYSRRTFVCQDKCSIFCDFIL